ncbi:hypothetical protein [Rhizobium ruizarguesonis]|uniref:hypothetical protein n=1 Tax=Rhizobium ruizarguesonis TaxID=2081791 RepID=UPI0010317D10|nr:hypothetical protein [Rhizobium ruizarguesonis]TBD80708.1 hypothetical protein ELH11_12780 [Rhizobium ruizarguesonis]TBE11869.1 hypothetical protein ELH09_12855 [Rhizobium ruizarguesonis]TBE23752.1 hypothetical protein ELH08_13085 [Rhizobium ruizarguesonis]TBE33593.1 hypothetical protein ELH07_13555 [Rhizobium ruizarguesonis]WSG99980.1 hypothetical protein U8P71_15295 [Rhizobium ruizarguesonis]
MKPLEVSDVAITERRFNIDLPLDTIENATIEFLPTAHLTGSTVIQNFAADEPGRVVLQSDFTVVPENIFEGVPPALMARTLYGDFVIRSKTWVFMQAQEYGPGTRHTLRDWIGFVELGLILGKSEFSLMFATAAPRHDTVRCFGHRHGIRHQTGNTVSQDPRASANDLRRSQMGR